MSARIQSVPIETTLIRKGLLQVGRDGGPVDGVDLFGTVRASGRLTLTDLDVLGWLSLRLRRDETSLLFSREELAEDLYGRRPGGRERAMVAASLQRLASTRMTLGGYHAASRQMIQDAAFIDVTALTILEKQPPARYAQPSWKVEFSGWILEQLAFGYATFIDWPTSRSLTGLPKRLWMYLEAQTHSSSWVALGQRGLTTLGLEGRRTLDARRAIWGAMQDLRDIGRHSYLGQITFSARHGHILQARRLEHQSRDVQDPLPGVALGRPRRAWQPLDTSHRRDEMHFDPAMSIVGSLAPARSGARRNARAMRRRPLADSKRVLLTGRLPDDQGELLDWMREEAEGLDRILIDLLDDEFGLSGLHNPSCPDLDTALAEFSLDGQFIAADGDEALSRWCAQLQIRVPKWCLTCRARFYADEEQES